MTDKKKSLQEWVREDKLLLVEDASGKQSLYKESANTNDKLLLYIAETPQEMKNYFRTRNMGKMPEVVAEDKLNEYTFPGEDKSTYGSQMARRDAARNIKYARNRTQQVVKDLNDPNVSHIAAAGMASGERDRMKDDAKTLGSYAVNQIARTISTPEDRAWDSTPPETHNEIGQNYLYAGAHVQRAADILHDRMYNAAYKAGRITPAHSLDSMYNHKDKQYESTEEKNMANRLEETSMFQGGPDNSTTGNPGMDYRTYLAAELFGSTSFASQVPTADTHQEQAVIQGTQAAEGMGDLRPVGTPSNNMYEHSIANQLIKLTKNLFRAGKLNEAAMIADAIEQPENAAAFVLEAAMATDGSVDIKLTEELYQTAAVLNNLQEG